MKISKLLISAGVIVVGAGLFAAQNGYYYQEQGPTTGYYPDQSGRQVRPIQSGNQAFSNPRSNIYYEVESPTSGALYQERSDRLLPGSQIEQRPNIYYEVESPTSGSFQERDERILPSSQMDQRPVFQDSSRMNQIRGRDQGPLLRSRDQGMQQMNTLPSSSSSSSSSMMGGQASDAEIQTRIQTILAGTKDTENKFSDIRVKVSNHIVTLSGFVDTLRDRQDLKNKISDIDGVKNIDDRIAVRNDGKRAIDSFESTRSLSNDTGRLTSIDPGRTSTQVEQNTFINTEASDRALETKVRDALKPGYLTKGFQGVIAEAHNGNVTLKGTVETEKEKKEVTNKIQKIDGVKGVNNSQLKVQQKPNKSY